MKITFLGTAAGKPTKDRNVTSIAIELDNYEYILIDCGEGTQQQILKSNLKFNKLNSIYITHLHADHIFGLPGLLATINEYRTDELNIYGPIGLTNYINFNVKNPYCNVNNYKINIFESDEKYKKINKIIYKNNCYYLECYFIHHDEFCYAYSITKSKNTPKINFKKLRPILDKYQPYIEKLNYNPIMKIINDLKQKKEFNFDDYVLKLDDFIIPENNFKITICLDNNDTTNILNYVKKTDILIHECTYIFNNDNKMQNKAIKYGHSTNIMAAKLADKLKCNKLILTHFSNRYNFLDEKLIIKECINYYTFGEIICAYDLLEIS